MTIDLDALRQSASLVDLVPDVKRKGRNQWFAPCPFHAERTASMSVRQEAKHG